MDGLRNLQIKIVSEKNSDVLDISDLRLINTNKKAIDIHKDIICHKFEYCEYNCKNYLARLKQGASVIPKDIYI